MNRIILDHLRRWRLLWLLLPILNGFFAAVLLHDSRTGKASGLAVATFQIVLWLGANQIAMDLGRGAGRVINSLPVTARELGWTWWILSVLLPALALVASSALGLMAYSAFLGRAFPFAALLAQSFTNAVFLGLLHFSSLRMIPNWPMTFVRTIRTLPFVILMLGMMFVERPFETTHGICLLVVASGFTIAGMFQNETLVRRRASYRFGAQISTNAPGRFQTPTGFGGLRLLWQTLYVRLAYATIAAMVGLLVLPLVQHGLLQLSLREYLMTALPAFSYFGFMFLNFALLMPLLMQLRHLRSLPISSGALAATLVLCPIAPLLVIGSALGVQSLIVPEARHLAVSCACFASAAILSLVIPLFVRLGVRMGTYTLLIGVSLILSGMAVMTPTIFSAMERLDLVIVLASLGTIALAFGWTRRLLKSSSQAYRIAPNMLSFGWVTRQ